MDETLKYFLPLVVLKLIIEDVVFLKKFKEFAPTIIDKIESFSRNTNCTCRTAIIEYVETNHEIVENFIRYFLNENPQVKIDFEEIKKENTPKNVQGKIFRIHKNDDSFRQFFEYTIENKFEFRQFSVVQDQDFWVIFFL